MQRRVLFLLCCLALTLSLPALADDKRDTLPTYSLSSIKGNAWNGLELGVTQAREVKSAYKTGPSEFPNGLRLALTRGVGLRVFTLFSGGQDADRLANLLIIYDNPRAEPRLQEELGEEGQTLYPPQRSDDWWVRFFPKKGIAAFVTRGMVSQVLLMPSLMAQRPLTGLQTERPPVMQVTVLIQRPPSAIGSVRVENNVRDLDFPDSRREHLLRRMRNSYAGGTLFYHRRATGTYVVTLSGRAKKGESWDLQASATISGKGIYGPIVGNSSLQRRVDSRDDPGEAAERAAERVMDEAEADFQANFRKSSPPTPEQLRVQEMGALLSALRQTSAGYL